MPVNMSATTLPEVAEFFDVSMSTVNRWRASGMPGKPSAYDLTAITTWLFTLGPWRNEQARDDYLMAKCDA
jgi:hypothetical protein